MDDLSKLLTHKHREAGLSLEQDAHAIYLKRGDRLLAKWWTINASIRSIWNEADNYTPKEADHAFP